jgi:hypothetical protein
MITSFIIGEKARGVKTLFHRNVSFRRGSLLRTVT